MGVSWVHPWKVKDVLVAWRRRMKKCLAFRVWKIIPLAIWGTTWKERNRRIFEGIGLSFQDFKLYFLRILYCWSHALDGGVNLTFLDFVVNIRQGDWGHVIFVFFLLYMSDTPFVSFNAFLDYSKKIYGSLGYFGGLLARGEIDISMTTSFVISRL